jgi:hypothetical protein
MKAFLFLSLMMTTHAQAQIFDPGPTGKEVILSDQTYTMTVALNPRTVLCLEGDYGARSFKIAVPEIDDVTFLDHTSPGAPGPCINAGFCKNKDVAWGAETDERFPIFHDLTKPTEVAEIRVIRKEVLSLTATSCLRTYVEHISSTIRGTEFRHMATLPLSEGPLSDCQK